MNIEEIRAGIVKIDKIINPCKVSEGNVYCHIVFDGWKLSITGVVAPMSNGDAKGGCGQITDFLTDYEVKEFKDGWTLELAKKFVEVWKEWHLNDMQAGTPKQTQAIKDWEKAGNKYDYEKACEFLKSAGIYEDNGYKYGHSWLMVEVPKEVIKFLDSLPVTESKPAWI